jgi:protein-tyrosine phosphatase
MARPRAGDWLEDEVANWASSGVGTVVSLLQKDEIIDLGLEMEEELCDQHGIRFLSFPIPDRGVPDTEAAIRFASDVASNGDTIAIHCRAGIGRSSIMAAAVLMNLGISANDALSAIELARRLPIPDTDAQREWILSLGRF